MSKSIKYNKNNAISIVNAAVDYHNNTTLSLEHSDEVEHTDVHTDRLRGKTENTYLADLLSNKDALNAKVPNRAKNVHAAIVGLHHEVADHENRILLFNANRGNTDAIEQLEKEGTIINKYEALKTKHGSGTVNPKKEAEIHEAKAKTAELATKEQEKKDKKSAHEEEKQIAPLQSNDKVADDNNPSKEDKALKQGK